MPAISTFPGFVHLDTCTISRQVENVPVADADPFDVVEQGDAETVLAQGVPIYLGWVRATDSGWLSDLDQSIDYYEGKLPAGTDVRVDDVLLLASTGLDYVVVKAGRLIAPFGVFAHVPIAVRRRTDS